MWITTTQEEGNSRDLKNLKGSMLGHFEMSRIPPNWLIDSKFGASHHRMAFIEYQPGVGIGSHDHTFEESYFVPSGEIAGCVHSFQNRSAKPVRWFETFSPQPPSEDAFRIMAEWQKTAMELKVS
jgi:hypothetical protein